MPRLIQALLSVDDGDDPDWLLEILEHAVENGNPVNIQGTAVTVHGVTAESWTQPALVPTRWDKG